MFGGLFNVLFMDFLRQKRKASFGGINWDNFK